MLLQRSAGALGRGLLAVLLVGVGCAGQPGGAGSTDGRIDSATGDGGGSEVTPGDAPVLETGADTGTGADAAVGGFTVTAAEDLKTTERGGQATFTVALVAAPTANVVVALASNMMGEGSPSPKMLTFTTMNWNAPQTVTVTGVDDQVADGDREYEIELAPAVSMDLRYHGLDPDDVALTNTDDETAGFTVVTGMNTATTEAGGQVTFTVALNSKPTAVVTVPVVSADTTEGLAAPTSLTFTVDNWNAPQTVTVTGVNDQEADGTVAYKVKLGPATGSDMKYTALMPVEVSLTNTDNETAGVTVTPPMTPTTTEAGGTAVVLIVLNSKPTASVVIGVSSSDTSEGTVAPASLTFTPDNWNAPQMVTATGADDRLSDGNQTWSVVTANTFSLDAKYHDLAVPDVVLTNTDNDSAGVTVTAPTGMAAATSEAGRQVTFTVVLNSQPDANVTIPLSSSDPGEGTLSAASVTFTASNWNAPQPVTVTGVDDFLADGSQPYSVVTGTAVSTDVKYMGIDAADVSLTNTDNDSPSISVLAAPFLTTTEAGGQATFTISLNSEPSGNVVIPISSSDTTEGTVGATTLTFTSVNWNAPQTVTVTGVNDNVADGSQVYSIVTGAAQSSDNAYQGIDPPNVLVFNTDNDTAGVTVTAATLLTTTEAGGQANFTVVLNSQPTADVTIPLSSSDTTEGSVSPSALVFTAMNWNVAQTVIVAGVNDSLADGAQTYTVVTGRALSADPSYNGVEAADVAASNTDNDSAGITLTAATGLTTTEGGGTATFTLVLNSQPSADVVIALASTDSGEGSVAPASLTFTAANWSTAQTVTVTGVDDDLDDGNQTYSVVTSAASSTDVGYSGLNPADVMLSNTDNDSAGVTVTPTGGLTVTEAAGAGNTATFTVQLNSEPSANVVIGLTSGDTTEGTVSASSLSFNAANWDVPQTVTITGVNDAIDDGDVAFTIVTAAATSTDTLYSGLDAANVSVTSTDNDAVGITVAAAAGLTVTEAAGAGNTATFTVALNSEPTANVVIGVSASDSTEATISATSLTFTAGNWSTAQTVTVTGVNDSLDDGDVVFSVVTAAATSSDVAYSGLNAADVTLTNLDNDTAGVTVTAAMGLAVTEAAGAGNQATFTVVLNTEPTANVQIGLTSSDTSEGTVPPLSLTFTSGNWSTPQTVTVTGVDDDVDDGNVDFTIVTAAAASSDASYSGMAIADVTVSNTDNDTGAITVTAAMGLTVTEAAGAGNTATFTVVLASQPTASVVIGLTSNDTTEGTVSPASLTFTTANWATAQTVTITGVNDSIDDADVQFSIVTAAAVTADAVYNGMNAADVTVTNTDNDTAAITVTAAMGLTVTEAAGAGNTATFTVVLATEPTADVVIGISSSDLTEGTVSPSFLSFTAANWSTPQTVTITGVDDAAMDGDVVFSIVTAAAVGTGSGYAGMNAADVSVTNDDDD